MKLFIDSCSDLSLERAKELDIEVLPLKIQLDDKSYLDQLEISSDEVITAIKEGKRPLTSQPNPESYFELFEPYVKEGTPIIYLGFSSELSGAFQSSVIARDTILEQYPEADITLIDSSAASYGLGMLVERAASYIKNGDNKDTIIKNIETDVAMIRHLFTVDDLNYLAKGGRLSKGSAFLGGLLNIKPLLHVENGQLVPVEKHRGLKKVFRRMTELVKNERANGLAHITHADAKENAELLKAQILENTDITEVKISSIGPTISSHTGAGTVALFYFQDGR